MNTRKALNIAAFALIVTGLLLKAMYMPGGSIAIILGAALLLAGLFTFAMKDNKEAGVPAALGRFLVGTLALLILALVFKIQRWPGASLLGVGAYVLAFALPVILVMQPGGTKISRQYLVTLFTFLVLLLGVLPRNPIAQFIGRGWDHPMTGEETAPPAGVGGAAPRTP